MEARLFKPARTAMQSGRGNIRRWVLEPEPREPGLPEPLMGWPASGDTGRQVRLAFETKEAALAYAAKHGLTCRIQEPQTRRIRPKSYAANFAHDRMAPWTH